MTEKYSKRELEIIWKSAEDCMNLAIENLDYGREIFWKEQAEKAKAEIEKIEEEEEEEMLKSLAVDLYDDDEWLEERFERDEPEW